MPTEEGERDPVEAAADDGRDLYDVVSWENRGVLDSVASLLYAGLSGNQRLLVMVVAALVFLGQLGGVVWLASRNVAVGVVALLSAIPALLLVALVWKQDVVEKEPADTLAVTFVLAVLFASFAAVVNSALGGVFRLVPVVGMALFFFLVVGPIEETVKWLAIRLHAFRQDTFDAVIDGAVYGAVAGLGFATIENVLYVVQQFATASGGTTAQALQAAVDTAYARALAGPGHVIYSAWAGYYLGLAKFNPDDRGPIVVKGLLVATVIHATYNTAVTYGGSLLNGLGFVAFVVVYDGVFFYLLYRKLRTYRDTYQEVGGDADAGASDASAAAADG